MQYVTVQQMRKIDEKAVKCGMPIELMMENAGREICNQTLKKVKKKKSQGSSNFRKEQQRRRRNCSFQTSNCSRNQDKTSCFRECKIMQKTNKDESLSS